MPVRITLPASWPAPATETRPGGTQPPGLFSCSDPRPSTPPTSLLSGLLSEHLDFDKAPRPSDAAMAKRMVPAARTTAPQTDANTEARETAPGRSSEPNGDCP